MTKTRELSDFLIEGGVQDIAVQQNPHIQPDTLYPSYVASGTSNKLLDGTTDHSGAFGTAQSDGRKYYYTNIAGSKPIKDPRIGAHFGSQRHKFKSHQLLEQETATSGVSVYSLDGREWARLYDKGDKLIPYNGDSYQGAYMAQTTTGDNFIEVVAYANDLNMLWFTGATRNFNVSVNGGTVQLNTGGTASVTSPLVSRYVDAISVVKVSFNSTPSLGINTFKISNIASNWFYVVGIELIVQDTSSTANRSKIQIPAQNVVSFGKKFAISATADHYDPFSAKTDGSAWTSPTSGTNNANSAASWPTNIDTANSLGLDKWVDGSSYYRPYNGGRVVKYVDSTGTIKTAVTIIPPNAKSLKSADHNKKAKNAGNTTYLPTFEDETTDVNEDNLHEVAKTYYARDFGNGGANKTSSHTKKDASSMDLTSATHTIAYVMDDGLTSLFGKEVTHHGGGSQNPKAALGPATANQYIYITFVGTGFSWTDADGTINQTAQNLPYGTHIVKINRSDYSITIDGVSIHTVSSGDTFGLLQVSFFQPKRPPIPEDAVVLADYMLMADFVPQTTAGPTYISKGTRRQSISRDVFVDHLDGTSLDLNHGAGGNDTSFGYYLNQSGTASSETRFKVRIHSFGINYVQRAYRSEERSRLFIGDTDKDSDATKDNTATYDSYAHLTTNLDLGVYNFGSNGESGTNGTVTGFDIATPIHTSHHYQAFETPFLHELVGGDRNMEQTNLVVSPDGKTWDEVTRNTNYLGNTVLLMNDDEADWNSGTDFSQARGENNDVASIQKDFAIGFDRFICLVDGNFNITYHGMVKDTGGNYVVMKNGSDVSNSRTTNVSAVHGTAFCQVTLSLVRGDYISTSGQRFLGGNWGRIIIERV